ncbi:heavy metal-responsive transcriptional regulator [Edaphobacter aggregans]|uniref:heavy metal-responsive transcriptional regulator n=1 Tax=Edaphobacter aggregans TaxID=570835 RepID=UPI00054FFE18|nr:heavy metal-responsive transcriptional regulator [Edaphobacter aggregans]
MGGVQIGKVASQTGMTIDAIRFYERSGLLPKPARSEGRYRIYHEQDIQKLKFIRRAQALGFSLQEIRELLLIQNEEVEACTHVRDLIEQKLVDVRAKLEQLRTLERELKNAHASCVKALARCGSSDDSCPVLEAIAHQKTR